MSSEGAPEWAGAVWVGQIDVADVDPVAVSGGAASGGAVSGGAVSLAGSEGYSQARLLVRRGRTVLGFVELPVVDLPGIGGSVSVDDLRSKVAALGDIAGTDDVGGASHVVGGAALPAVTVIICTRDRAEQLRGALTSVLAIDYPFFDVVVVDNAGATDATRELIRTEFTDPRVRIVGEPVAGLSRARNTGLLAATGEIVAYTDDDVVVDSHWLTALVAGFARGADVDCVTGLVPSGELRTPVQRYFDDRVSWSRNLVAREFRLSAPPADLPVFPFSVGEFGTGANFALRRSFAIRIGGFDTAFGVGTRTGGGEDLDMFTRVLFEGSALVVEPSALVWHRHRADLGALRHQAVGYGRGLGAWLTKVALSPTMLKVAARRVPVAVSRLAGKAGGTLEGSADPSVSGSAAGSVVAPAGTDWAKAVSRVGWTELFSVASGPARYLRQRWDGAGLIDPLARSAALARSSRV